MEPLEALLKLRFRPEKVQIGIVTMCVFTEPSMGIQKMQSELSTVGFRYFH
jgi:hypothetical protein